MQVPFLPGKLLRVVGHGGHDRPPLLVHEAEAGVLLLRLRAHLLLQQVLLRRHLRRGGQQLQQRGELGLAAGGRARAHEGEADVAKSDKKKGHEFPDRTF